MTKPLDCCVCGCRAKVLHVEHAQAPHKARQAAWELEPVAERPRRYAQVRCRMCATAGPEMLFDLSDEWPHIAAEKDAIDAWNWLHRSKQCD